MHSVPDPTPIPSDPAPGPRLIITPDGLEIYHDLRRNKLFVTFHYRRDKPVRLATVYAWIGELLDDIAQAGLLVRGPLTVLLSPQSVDQATSQSAFTASLKVEVRPRAEEAQESAAWVEALRAHFARRPV